jgi:hypothetical protein
MPAAPCSHCGTPHLTAGGLCPDCKLERDQRRGQREQQRRGTTTQRGRGWQHQKRAAALRTEAEAKGLPCHLCQRPIDYRLRKPNPWAFEADHLDTDPLGPLAPAHSYCNGSKGKPA